MDRLNTRGPTAGTGAAQAVAVYDTSDMRTLQLQLAAATTAFTACAIKARIAPGGDLITIASAAADYTAPAAGSYILKADKSPVTLAAGAVASVAVAVHALAEVRVEVTQLATGTATVDAWVKEFMQRPA